MKKTLLFLFALLCALPYAWAQATTSQPAVGDGSEANPYQITSPDELRWFALHVGESTANASACAKLMNDITMSTMTIDLATGTITNQAVVNMKPIGAYPTAAGSTSYYMRAYTGTFDGQGHVITGLNSSAYSYYNGRPGFVSEIGAEGKIKNLIINNIYGSSFGEGLFCNTNSGTIENCHISGYIRRGDSGATCPGFCNINKGTISSSTSDVYIESAAGSSSAGFCTSNSGVISNCYSKSTINVQDQVSSGFCETNNGTITNCCAVATIKNALTTKPAIYGFVKTNNTSTNSGNYAMSTPAATGTVSGNTTGITTVSSIAAITNHYFDAQGICTLHGNDYQPATQASDGYYEIKNAGNLKWFAQTVNAGSASINGRLMNDIDLAVVCSATAGNWTPIGYETNGYRGTLNGGGHTLSHLYIKDNTANDNWGLFGLTEGACHIDNLNVSGEVSVKGNSAALLVGCSYGHISGCCTSGKVEGGASVGGISGTNNSPISQSYNAANVTATNGVCGGIAGSSIGLIRDCYNSGTVTSAGTYAIQAGGIAGYLSHSGAVADCYNVVDVTISGTVTAAAAIIGVNESTASPSYTNNYYLSTSTTSAGYGTATLAADFKSGRIARLLIGGDGTTQKSDKTWGQTIGTDAYPVFLTSTGSNAVYAVYIEGVPTFYGNTGASFTLPKPAKFLDLNIMGDTYSDGTNTYTTSCTLPSSDLKLTAAIDNMLKHVNTSDFFYEITTARQLAWLAYYVSKGNVSVDVRLMNDIDLAGVCSATLGSWTPIGNYSNKYAGTFDGGNHTVSGLYINSASNSDVGLLGAIGEKGGLFGTIENLHVKGSVEMNSQTNNVGLLAGIMDMGCTISNCTTEGSVISRGSCVGGVVGSNDGTVSHVSSSAQVYGYSIVGGIAGAVNLHGTVSSSENSGQVTSENVVSGGIAGRSNSKIDNGYNTGNVILNSTFAPSPSAGGIVGEILESASTTNCYNTGTVTVGGNKQAANAILYCPSGSTTTAKNNYYLNEDATVTTPYGTRKTAAEFQSGLIARLLNGGDGTTEKPTGAWGQTVGTDATPLLGAQAVYSFTTDGTVTGYYNEGNKVTLPYALSFDGLTAKEKHYTENNIAVTNPYVIGKADAKIISSSTTTDMSNCQAQDGYYEITTPTQLAWLAYYVNKGNTNTNARLMNDIDLASVCGEGIGNWTPIGIDDSYSYTGQFDGGNHTISNFYVKTTESSIEYWGLFGSVGGTVLKVHVAGQLDCPTNGGLVAGITNGNVEDCTSSGSVKCSNDAGGIVGLNSSILRRCSNYATVTGKIAGGIVGLAVQRLYNCFNAGDVKGSQYTGGIAGRTSDILVSCCNVANLPAASAIVGYNQNNYDIRSCFYKSESASVGSATARPAADFKSGVVARLLNDGNGTTERAYGSWGQTMGTDSVPVIGGPAVYKVSIDNAFWACGNKGKSVALPAHPSFSGTTVTATSYSDGTNTYVSTCPINQSDISLTTGSTASEDMQNHLVNGYYEISTSAQLAWFANYVNAGNTSINGRLMNDIDLSGLCSKTLGNWTPIGNYSNGYAGTFDGGSHKISNLYIKDEDSSGDLFGLFGFCKGNMKNLSVSGDVNVMGFHAGLIAGYNSGNITDCSTSGTVQGASYVGGIAGDNDGPISQSCNSANILSTGGICGGIAGYSRSVIRDCYNSGTITSPEISGGIAGWQTSSSSVINCYNVADVSIESLVSAAAAILGVNESSASPSYTNNYYLSTSTTSAGYGTATLAADFKSGRIARLLNGGDGTAQKPTGAWGQKLATNLYPLLGGPAVCDIQINSVSQGLFSTGSTVALPENTSYSDTKILTTAYTDGTSTSSFTYTVGTTDVNLLPQGTSEEDMATHLVDGYYEISKPTHLAWLAYWTNLGGYGQNARLMNDINLSSICSVSKGSWTPIGLSLGDGRCYNGIFDGCGKKVSGLYLTSSAGYYDFCYGLFGVSNGTVKRLTVGGTVNATTSEAYTGSALVVGANEGHVDSCTAMGNVMGGVNAGGVVGVNYAYIDRSFSLGKGIIRSNMYAGGICGSNYGCISDCANEAGATSPKAAGITGQLSVAPPAGPAFPAELAGTVRNCFNNGQFTQTTFGPGLPIVNQKDAGSKELNCYFLDGVSVPDLVAVNKPLAELQSGKVTRLLNGGDGTTEKAAGVWGQTLGTDNFPKLLKADKGNIVYMASVYDGSISPISTDYYLNSGGQTASASPLSGNQMAIIHDADVDPSLLGDNIITADGKAHAIILQDGCGFCLPINVTAETVNYTRFFYSDGFHNTICLPFAPDDVSVPYVASEYQSKDDANAYFHTVSAMEAGKPYLFLLLTEKNLDVYRVSFSAKNALVLGEPVVSQNVLKGSFINMEGSNFYILGVYDKTDGSGYEEIFKQSTTEYKVSPFRAYLDLSGTSSKGLHLVFDSPTGIHSVSGTPAKPVYYDLQGRPVRQLEHGQIYIINGKKQLYK